MSVRVYSVFMLSYVQVAALRRADTSSKESYRLCKSSRNCKSGQGPTQVSRAIDRERDRKITFSFQKSSEADDHSDDDKEPKCKSAMQDSHFRNHSYPHVLVVNDMNSGLSTNAFISGRYRIA
jgi:hypothetical protein